ncbi:hypothetical protein HZC08_01930 [Candidatus Micrarchaeota archaeon]|nr:hypothetical protein [Candidatus Micrarchaeota archaeon]
MDSITAFISSLDNYGLSQFSLVIHDNIGFLVSIAALLLFTEPRFDKRNKVLFVLVVAFLISIGVKEILMVERPIPSLVRMLQ